MLHEASLRPLRYLLRLHGFAALRFIAIELAFVETSTSTQNEMVSI
jgi:hypothetical protein